MTDPARTIQELLEEISSLKKRTRELEKSEVECRLKEAALRESEGKYHLLIDTAQESIVVAQDGRLKFVNPMTLNLLEGYSEQELLDRPFPEFIHQDDRSMVVENYRRRIANEEAQTRYAFRVVTHDGIVKWVEINAALITWQGKPATLNFLTDITEQKRMYEALRLQEIQLRAIVESTGNGILAVDNAGRVILSNRRFADLWNIPPGLLESKNDEALLIYVLNQLVDQDAFLKKVQLLYQSTTSDYDRILFKDGRMMERYSYPLLNEGAITGRVWSFRDITDQHRAETALRNSELLFKNAFSMSPAMMGIHRLRDGIFLEINRMIPQYTGYQMEELISHKIDELGFLDSATLQQLRKTFSEQNGINNEEIQYKTKTGELRYGLYSAALIGDDDEKKVLGLLFDITKWKHSEALLKLQEEESKRLAKNLEEANIALRVVLFRREEDQRILEEKIQLNVNEIILPFIGLLKSAHLETRDKHYLDLLESNLKSILSPFMRYMSITYKSLTSKETQIAEMIRQGKNSKDIAEMLGTSVATINTHRNNIRKKLNMKNQKTNLRSHLLSHS